jgi:hypothetical protein
MWQPHQFIRHIEAEPQLKVSKLPRVMHCHTCQMARWQRQTCAMLEIVLILCAKYKKFIYNVDS